MPAIRAVGARFIAPACRQTVRWAMCKKCCRTPWPPGLSPRPRRSWSEMRTAITATYVFRLSYGYY